MKSLKSRFIYWLPPPNGIAVEIFPNYNRDPACGFDLPVVLSP